MPTLNTTDEFPELAQDLEGILYTIGKPRADLQGPWIADGEAPPSPNTRRKGGIVISNNDTRPLVEPKQTTQRS